MASATYVTSLQPHSAVHVRVLLDQRLYMSPPVIRPAGAVQVSREMQGCLRKGAEQEISWRRWVFVQDGGEWRWVRLGCGGSGYEGVKWQFL